MQEVWEFLTYIYKRREREIRMVERCRKCGAKYVKFPLKDENGKWIIKNLFKIDMISIMFLIAIIFMTISYNHDMEECRTITERPCTYAMKAGCCNLAYNNGVFYDPNVELADPNVEPEYVRFGNITQ